MFRFLDEKQDVVTSTSKLWALWLRGCYVGARRLRIGYRVSHLGLQIHFADRTRCCAYYSTPSCITEPRQSKHGPVDTEVFPVMVSAGGTHRDMVRVHVDVLRRTDSIHENRRCRQLHCARSYLSRPGSSHHQSDIDRTPLCFDDSSRSSWCCPDFFQTA